MKMKDIVILLSVLLYYGLSGADTGRVSVSVKEGDSVIVNTGVITNQQEIRLYFNNVRIARITRNLSYICTDVQCKYSDERFRGRLKVDHQTGSLTIMNTTTEDSGLYKLWSSTNNSEETFSVVVHGVSSAERDEMKRKSVKEGESVTLDPAVINNPNDVMTWHFNGIVISEITGNQSKICTDDQCDERFRDRLKLDHQTGSLTITNTRTTDSGEYKLKITSSSSILRRRRSISVTSVTSFRVTVIAAPDSGPPRGAIGGIVAVIAVIAVLLLVAAVARRKGSRGQHSNQRNDDEDPTSNQNDPLMMKTPNAMSHSPTEASNDT